MIELVTNRLGRVGVNVVLIDVIKYPLFFFGRLPLVTLTTSDQASHPRFGMTQTDHIMDEKNLPGFNIESIHHVKSRCQKKDVVI